MYKIIEQLCDEKGITIYKLCKELNISSSTFTELKSGRTKELSAKNASKVADHFGVTVDYLLGKSENKKPPTSDMETWTVHNFEGNGTHTTTVNPENLNSLKKLLDTAGELTPEKIEALIKVAENMK